MAERRPLVVVGGQVKELPTGDTIGTGPITTILDEYYASVELLLHGANLIDNSPSPKTITATGNAGVSTVQSKFGGSSFYFDGTGDAINLPSGYWSISSGANFTVEFWAYPTAAPSSSVFLIGGTNSMQVGYNGTNLGVAYFGVAWDLIGNTGLTLNVWNHVAVVRNAGTLTIYKDGVSIGSAANTRAFADTAYTINSTANAWTGYVDEFRFTKGVARYTANFTPPVAAFPDSYSSTTGPTTDPVIPYLTGGVRDVSTSTGTGAFALANTPPTSYQSFSSAFVNGQAVDYCIQSAANEWEVGTGTYLTPGPGDPDYASVAALLHFDGVNGSTAFIDSAFTPKSWIGSGAGATISTTQNKFGGSSLSLNGSSWLADSTFATLFGSPFTLEMWVYRTGSVGPGIYLFTVSAGNDDWNASGNSIQIIINSSAAIVVAWRISPTAPTTITSGTTSPLNTWQHVAVSYDGTTFRLFLDGVAAGSSSTAWAGSTVTNARIGSGPTGASSFPGFIDEFRISRGLARYTGAFTPSIAAFPNYVVPPPTLTRTTVRKSSNSNVLVNFSAGTKQVFALPNAEPIRQAASGRQYANSRGFALP